MPSSDLTRAVRRPEPGTSLGRVPIGPISTYGSRDRLDPLVRKLALDRLRDLRDDGVTTDYIGRMYGVSRERLLELERDLKG